MNQATSTVAPSDAPKRAQGRPKIHENDAARYRAFREQRQAAGMREVRLWVPAGEKNAVNAARALLAAALLDASRAERQLF